MDITTLLLAKEYTDKHAGGGIIVVDKLPTQDIKEGQLYQVDGIIYRYSDNEWKTLVEVSSESIKTAKSGDVVTLVKEEGSVNISLYDTYADSVIDKFESGYGDKWIQLGPPNEDNTDYGLFGYTDYMSKQLYFVPGVYYAKMPSECEGYWYFRNQEDIDRYENWGADISEAGIGWNYVSYEDWSVSKIKSCETPNIFDLIKPEHTEYAKIQLMYKNDILYDTILGADNKFKNTYSNEDISKLEEFNSRLSSLLSSGVTNVLGDLCPKFYDDSSTISGEFTDFIDSVNIPTYLNKYNELDKPLMPCIELSCVIGNDFLNCYYIPEQSVEFANRESSELSGIVDGPGWYSYNKFSNEKLKMSEAPNSVLFDGFVESNKNLINGLINVVKSSGSVKFELTNIKDYIDSAIEDAITTTLNTEV